MTAARIHRFGAPDVIFIEDVPVPLPKGNEIQVRIHAAGVGPWDGLVRAGKSSLPQRLPLILGSEIAGTVERVGPSVSEFSPGDRVFGVCNDQFTGGYAECGVASAAMLAAAPKSLSWIDAASVPVAAVTALQMLSAQGQSRAWKNIFVHGGAGSVGAYVIQLARHAGMTVHASIRKSGAHYARRLGAETVIDTDKTDLTGEARWADLVIDTVGDTAQDELLDILKPGGMLVSSAARPDAAKAAAKGVKAVAFIVDVTARDLATIADLFDRKLLQTNVGTVLPLHEARLAHEMLEGQRAHAPGKIVLEDG